MKVFGTGVDTSPKTARIAFRGGDVCDPQDGDQLQPSDRPAVWPTRVKRWFCCLPILPWVSLRYDSVALSIGSMALLWNPTVICALAFLALALIRISGKVHRFGCYAGWKCYGFDRPDYLNWPGIKQEDVHEGSLALELTARFFTDGE